MSATHEARNTAASNFGAAAPAQTGGWPRRLFGQWGTDRLLWAFLAVVVFAVAILPLLYTVNSAFYAETDVGLAPERSLESFLRVYASADYYAALFNAIVLATGVTVLSLITGVFMALLVARTDVPAKPLLDLLIIMPLFISPFTGMIAWVALGSEQTGFFNVLLNDLLQTVGLSIEPLVNVWSRAGIVWVMFLFFCPFSYLFVVGNLRSMDSSMEEAARAHGATPLQALFRVTLPMISPAIIASGLLIFILSAEMYTIPSILGAPISFDTLATRIYKDSTSFPVHQAHAAAAATMLLLVTIVGVILQRRSTRKSERFVTLTGKGFNGRLQALGAWRWPALGVVALYVLSADILPFASLILSSLMKYSAPMITSDLLTLKHYARLITLPSVHDALYNTILLGVLSGAICVCIGLVISYMEMRRGGPAAKAVALLATLPVAVPGLVYGIGILWLAVQTPLFGTIWVLLIAYVAKFLPYGVVIGRAGLIQVHPELEQSARTLGASGLTTLWRITIPLLGPVLIAIFFFVMLQSIKELSASVLLYDRNSQVLSVLTWSYMDAGSYQFAAAIGVVQTVIMVGLVFITRLFFRIKLERAMSNR